MSRNPLIRVCCALAVVLAVGQIASADLITNTLGDRGDGYTLVQISYSGDGSNTGTWTVPTGVSSIEIMVVGGGGAGARGGAFGSNGGTGGSPGGGAGGLYYSSAWAVTDGSSMNVAVGIGAPTTTATGNGADGSQSVFDSIIAYGGQGGQYTINQGGNQGGYSIDGGYNVTPGFLGGTGAGATGGAGATENGRNGGYSPAYGGAGLLDPITGNFGVIDALGNPISGFYGNMIGFAGGGSAGYDGELLGVTHGEPYGGGSGTEPEGQPGGAGFDLTGGGGGGGRSANGGGGGDGVIYIAYQAVPEPGTLVLLGMGLLGLAAYAWRKRK